MADDFTELLKDCRLGMEVREQRERQAADAARATLAKAHAAAAERAEANSAIGRNKALLKSMKKMAADAETLAKAIDPNYALKEKIAQANAGMAKALAAGQNDLACKLECHRNNFLSQLV